MPLFPFLAMCVLVGWFWGRKGRSPAAGFFLSLFLTPIVGAVVGLVIAPDPAKREARDLGGGYSKPCPRCAESVRRAARVCRYCGHEFPDPVFERLEARWRAAAELREDVAASFVNADAHVRQVLWERQLRLLRLPADFELDQVREDPERAKAILERFPDKAAFRLVLERAAENAANTLSCPHCGHRQPRVNPVCSHCYRDLARVDPETGEIVSIFEG